MKLSSQQLADALYYAYNGSLQGTNEEYLDAMEAHEADALEIEGYERVQWVKFDPNDKSTRPGMNTRVLVWLDNNIFCGRFRDFEVEFSRYGEGVKTVYWRPLPPPPVKNV